MSGGYFDYAQDSMEEIAGEIEYLIKMNGLVGKDEWGDDIRHCFPPEIIERFKETVHATRQAQKMVRRVDWLLSGDDGEKEFMSRWDNEVGRMFKAENIQNFFDESPGPIVGFKGPCHDCEKPV